MNTPWRLVLAIVLLVSFAPDSPYGAPNRKEAHTPVPIPPRLLRRRFHHAEVPVLDSQRQVHPDDEDVLAPPGSEPTPVPTSKIGELSRKYAESLKRADALLSHYRAGETQEPAATIASPPSSVAPSEAAAYETIQTEETEPTTPPLETTLVGNVESNDGNSVNSKDGNSFNSNIRNNIESSPALPKETELPDAQQQQSFVPTPTTEAPALDSELEALLHKWYEEHHGIAATPAAKPIDGPRIHLKALKCPPRGACQPTFEGAP